MNFKSNYVKSEVSNCRVVLIMENDTIMTAHHERKIPTHLAVFMDSISIENIFSPTTIMFVANYVHRVKKACTGSNVRGVSY